MAKLTQPKCGKCGSSKQKKFKHITIAEVLHHPDKEKGSLETFIGRYPKTWKPDIVKDGDILKCLYKRKAVVELEETHPKTPAEEKKVLNSDKVQNILSELREDSE